MNDNHNPHIPQTRTQNTRSRSVRLKCLFRLIRPERLFIGIIVVLTLILAGLIAA